MKKGTKFLAVSLAGALFLSGVKPMPIVAKSVSTSKNISSISDGDYVSADVINITNNYKVQLGKNGALNTYYSTDKPSLTIENEYYDSGSLENCIKFDSDGYWTVRIFNKRTGECESKEFTVDKHAPICNDFSVYDGKYEEKGDNVGSPSFKKAVKNNSSYLVTFKDTNLEEVIIDDPRFHEKYGSYADVDSSSFSWTIKGVSNKTIICTAKDKAGNVTTLTLVFKDLPTPKITDNIRSTLLEEKHTYITGKGVRFTAESFDDDVIEFKIDSKNYTSNDLFDNEGIHTVEALGEYGATTVKFIIDYTKPSASFKNGAKFKAGKKALTKGVFKDSLSGIDYSKFKLVLNGKQLKNKDGDMVDAITGRDVINYKLKKKGNYTIKFSDKAGNTRTMKFKVI